MKSSAVLSIIIALSASIPAQAAKVYGVAVDGATQTLVTWDSATPSVILSSVLISNLPTNETIRGIDFDPIHFFPGQQRLFAIGAGHDQTANVYQLHLSSGITNKPPQLGGPPANATGQHYGVTFAGSNALRSVTDANQLAGYLVANNSGAGAGSLAYSPGDVSAGQTPRPVHRYNDIIVDSHLDILGNFTNSGSPRPLSTIGSLGADFDDEGAIDLDDSTSVLYAALLPAGQTQSSFYTLNQQTGAVTLIGPIGNGLLITAMAVEPPLRPVPEPAAAILLAAALLACVRLRRNYR